MTTPLSARTHGDLPPGAETEVFGRVVPCGSGGEVGIAIVAPPLSPLGPQARVEGVVKPGPHGRFEASCGQTWKHGIRCRLTSACVGVRGQNEARGRPLGLQAAWLACARFSKDADEHASVALFLCFGERTAHRNAFVAQPHGADLTLLELFVRVGEFGARDIGMSGVSSRVVARVALPCSRRILMSAVYNDIQSGVQRREVFNE